MSDAQLRAQPPWPSRPGRARSRYDGRVKTAAAPLPARPRWRARLHEIIFEADTPAGRAFDVALLVAILTSVLAVVLESVAEIRDQYGDELRTVEWILTGAFTVEYILRLMAVDRPGRYARSGCCASSGS